jgi:hypothetical protein
MVTPLFYLFMMGNYTYATRTDVVMFHRLNKTKNFIDVTLGF